MIEMTLPLPPALWATMPAPIRAPLLEQVATLRQENAALHAENAVLQERIRELETRMGQNSSNSSRPPSTDLPQATPRPKAPPTGRKRGGQPGHRGTYCALLLVEQVDESVTVVPERCRWCQQPFPEAAASSPRPAPHGDSASMFGNTCPGKCDE